MPPMARSFSASRQCFIVVGPDKPYLMLGAPCRLVPGGASLVKELLQRAHFTYGPAFAALTAAEVQEAPHRGGVDDLRHSRSRCLSCVPRPRVLVSSVIFCFFLKKTQHGPVAQNQRDLGASRLRCSRGRGTSASTSQASTESLLKRATKTPKMGAP